MLWHYKKQHSKVALNPDFFKTHDFGFLFWMFLERMFYLLDDNWYWMTCSKIPLRQWWYFLAFIQYYLFFTYFYMVIGHYGLVSASIFGLLKKKSFSNDKFYIFFIKPQPKFYATTIIGKKFNFFTIKPAQPLRQLPQGHSAAGCHTSWGCL